MELTPDGQRRARRWFLARRSVPVLVLVVLACVLAMLTPVVGGERRGAGLLMGAVSVLVLVATFQRIHGLVEHVDRTPVGPYPPRDGRLEYRFAAVRDWFTGLAEDYADALQDAYEQAATAEHERAALRCAFVLEAADRYHVGDEDCPVFAAVDHLCGIVGGAADLALAVLGRDIIHPRDYDVLTCWARDAGVPIPGEMPAAT